MTIKLTLSVEEARTLLNAVKSSHYHATDIREADKRRTLAALADRLEFEIKYEKNHEDRR